MRPHSNYLRLIAGMSLSQAALAADEPTTVNQPAEKYAIGPGGVDMRTGQYVYSETDLQIGPENGRLALVRTTPVYIASHANPFRNFSHNWDIMLLERRINLNPPLEQGPDFRMNFHAGGRSFTFEGGENSAAYAYKSDGPLATLTWTGGSKASSTVVYTIHGPDGTLYQFRPMGGLDCADTSYHRCAYVSQITEPDGTVYSFQYAYDPSKSGNRARLIQVTSTRGYALLLEGSDTRVTKACVLNLTIATIPSDGLCPSSAPATSVYSYTPDGTRLATVTGPDNGISQFVYGTVNNNGVQFSTVGFIKPGYSAPWLTNTHREEIDEEGAIHEIVYGQAFADNRTYNYQFNRSPYAINKPIPTIAGGVVVDGHGHQIVYQYDWPIMPGSRERICRQLPCSPPSPEDEYKYTYQQTPGPVLIEDELGREYSADYCDPVVKAGVPNQDPDKCAVIPIVSFTDPEGIKTELKHDPARNIIEAKRIPKTGSGLPPIITSAQFALTNPKAQTKPLWRKDGNQNQTDYTYDDAHGGILTETGPQVGGIRPQKRFSYVSRHAWIAAGSGYAPAASPIWLLASESSCRTLAWTGTACGQAGSNDEVVISYDYGPDSGPNNLLLRGMVISADGQSRRTCYGYDPLGRKISETAPNANLTSCP